MRTNKASGVFYAELDKKDAEIAALREALDGMRWNDYTNEFTGERPYCRVCYYAKVKPEVHAPDCKIGKLFAPKPETTP